MFNPAFIGYRVQQEGPYTILGTTSCTLTRLLKHAFTILYTILGKTSSLIYRLHAPNRQSIGF